VNTFFRVLKTGGVKIPQNILLDETGKRNNNIWVLIDKSVVKVGKSKKWLDIFKFSMVSNVIYQDKLLYRYWENQKNIIYKLLEDSRSVSKTKVYNKPFK